MYTPTWLQLTYEILKKKGEPMSIKEITKEALEIKTSSGKTPYHTIRVAMYRDTKGRFKRVGRGFYGLTEWKTE